MKHWIRVGWLAMRALMRSVRMAGITCRAVVQVSVYTLVVIVCFRIRVTNDTTEDSVVAWRCVTIRTLIPCIFMASTVNGEIHAVVIPVGRNPGCFAVAILAGSRKTCRNVVWIVGLVVI